MERATRALTGLLMLAGLAIASGCVPKSHGWASGYSAMQQKQVAVIMPTAAPSISQQFLDNPHAPGGHLGIDVTGKTGSPVIAAADGTVVQSFFEPMYGNRVVVEHAAGVHGKRSQTVYMHLSERLVSPGTPVARGQLIARLGATGALAGGYPHLHFEVHRETSPGSGLTLPFDPHLFWADGPGRVTCFDPAASYDSGRFAITYPAPCS